MSRKRGAADGPGWTGPTTPREIRSATFRPSPVAWRGYSPIEVKELLDAAADALQEWQDECVGLEAEVERLRYFYRSHSGASLTALPAAGEEGGGLVATLRRYAATQVQQAVDYADGVRERPAEAGRLLVQARIRTAIVVEEAARMAGLPLRTAAARGEMEQARLWVSCLAHALRAQAAAVHDAVGRRTAS